MALAQPSVLYEEMTQEERDRYASHPLHWKQAEVGGVKIDTSNQPEEVARLCGLVRGKRVLEVGTGYGYTAAVMALAGATVTTVDTHTNLLDSKPKSEANFKAVGVEVRQVIGSSHDVLPAMTDRFDVVFVDGDHTYEGARADVEDGWKLVAPGGWLAVHDYGNDLIPEVKRAVDDVLSQPDEVVGSLWLRQSR